MLAHRKRLLNVFNAFFYMVYTIDIINYTISCICIYIHFHSEYTVSCMSTCINVYSPLAAMSLHFQLFSICFNVKKMTKSPHAFVSRDNGMVTVLVIVISMQTQIHRLQWDYQPWFSVLHLMRSFIESACEREMHWAQIYLIKRLYCQQEREQVRGKTSPANSIDQFKRPTKTI